ncbi:MAG: terpene cyclase/mutase family protein [Actinomycetota bacterium]|nr:terpene cyclase/mutase family protein [Actinomycetota bacterium]
MKGILVHPRYFTRAAAAVCALVLVSPTGSAHAAPGDRARAESAATWQAGQLEDGVIKSTFDGFSYTDWGLTIDTAFALAAEGSRVRALNRAAAKIEENYYSQYATYQGVVSANAMSKVLTAAKVLRQDPRDFGGRNVRRLVLRLVAGPEAGLEEGRVRDSNYAEPNAIDYSNTFGQAFAVIGLSRSGRVPATSVDYLLRQQCSQGYFRIFAVKGETCERSGSPADPDATALSIQALVAARKDGADFPQRKLDKAVGWLLDAQRLSGGFGGGADTPSTNANSTGLAAQALNAVGRSKARDKAAEYVATVQLTRSRVGDGPAREDVGAIAYDKSARNAAIADGVTQTTVDQFRRATAQGLFAFTPSSLVTLRRP